MIEIDSIVKLIPYVVYFHLPLGKNKTCTGNYKGGVTYEFQH